VQKILYRKTHESMRATGAARHHCGPRVVYIKKSFWPLVLHGCPRAVRELVQVRAHWRNPNIAALRMSITGRCFVYQRIEFGQSTCTRGTWRRRYVVLFCFLFRPRAAGAWSCVASTNLDFHNILLYAPQVCIRAYNYKRHCEQSLNAQYDSPCNAL
jgi:hypothetical protein